MIVNLNNHVKVTLTEKGKRILHQFTDGKYLVPEENGDLKIQIWEFMQIFGPHMTLGVSEVISPLTMEILDNLDPKFGQPTRKE